MQAWITKHNGTEHAIFQRSPPRSADNAPAERTPSASHTRRTDEVSLHRRREPLYTRNTRFPLRFLAPKKDITPQSVGSSHSNAKFKDHLCAALTLGDHFCAIRAQTKRQPHPSHKRSSPIVAGSHFARENTGLRAIPNITLTQQFHCDLQSLRCKSHYNCVDHSGNQQDVCSHSTAICTDEFYFTMGDAFERKQAKTAPIAQMRFPPSTPGATSCEKTQGFDRFLTPKHHLDTAVVVVVVVVCSRSRSVISVV